MYDKQEKEISIKSMLYAALYRWKKALIVAVVLAVALGGYKGYKAWVITNDAVLNAENKEAYETAVKEYETTKAALEHEIAVLGENIENQQEYLETSAFMKLDYHDVYVETARWYIETDYQIMPGMTYQNPDKTGVIQQAYQSAVTSDEAVENLARTVKMSPKFLKELINVTVEKETPNTFTVVVYHSDPNKAETIMCGILENVNQMHEQITGSVGAHTISLMGKTAGFSVQSDVAVKQKNERQFLTDNVTQQLKKIEELKNLNAPEEELITTSTVVKKAVKWAVIGGVLGVFLVVLWGCCQYMFGDKIYSGEELRVRAGVKIMGSIVDDEKMDPITRWLKKKEHRPVHNTEENMELIAANARTFGSGAKTILVAGDQEPEKIAEFAQQLQKKLGADFQILSGNLLLQAQAVDSLRKCDGVLLLEKCNHSRYSAVEKELDCIQSAGKNLIGCLMSE